MTANVLPFRIPVLRRPMPIGLFLHVGYSDHKDLADLAAASPMGYHGCVLDASWINKDRGCVLVEPLNSVNAETVLDPMALQAAFVSGRRSRFQELSWLMGGVQTPADWQTETGMEKLDEIVAFAVKHKFSAMLAPTHFITSPNDPWLAVDIENAIALKRKLQSKGIALFYRLAVSNKVIVDVEQRDAIIDSMQRLNVDAIWLVIDRFSKDASFAKFSAYCEAATAFHDLGVPLVADRVGGLPGLALAAFGVVSGIAHGVAQLESFDSASLNRAPDPEQNSGGSPTPVYLGQLGISFKPAQIEVLASSRAVKRSQLFPTDPEICPTGPRDMIQSPKRSFVLQRAKEIHLISKPPSDVRAGEFLEKIVRPMSDLAVALQGAAAKGLFDEALSKKLTTHSDNLRKLRTGFSERLNTSPTVSQAVGLPTRQSRSGS